VPYEFRYVGLHATLTVNTNAFSASGAVFGCDNMDFYGDEKQQQDTVTGAYDTQDNAVDPQFDTLYDSYPYGGSSTTITNLTGPFNGLQQRCLRYVNLGDAMAGRVFEASVLPTNDRMLQYTQKWPTHVAAASSPAIPAAYYNGTTSPPTNVSPYPGDSMADDLANFPCILFQINGIPNSSGTVQAMTLTLGVTFTIECQIRSGSVLGFLQESARFMKRFLVDWSLLQTIPSAALFSQELAALIRTPMGRLGYQAAKSGKNASYGTTHMTRGGAISALGV
jgi:hypothetical protein